MRAEDETVDEYRARLREDIGANPDKYYRRGTPAPPARVVSATRPTDRAGAACARQRSRARPDVHAGAACARRVRDAPTDRAGAARARARRDVHAGAACARRVRDAPTDRAARRRARAPLCVSR